MTRSRAADDFGTIRARMEELRRQRTPAPSEHSSPLGPRPYHVAPSPSTENGPRRPPHAIRQKLFGRKSRRSGLS
jgi:hypothetical protein